MKKLGFCISGSFCSMDDMLEVLKSLKSEYDIEVFITPNVNNMNTRFYNAKDLKEKIESITYNKIHTTIQEAEIYGPFRKLDIVLIYPCDGNTLAKLVHGINDHCVTMLVKSSLRNNIPIVLGVYTNDLLGNSGINFMSLLNRKNYFFVPIYQDDYINKPNSMIADYQLVNETLKEALNNKQIQPLMLGYKKDKYCDYDKNNV